MIKVGIGMYRLPNLSLHSDIARDKAHRRPLAEPGIRDLRRDGVGEDARREHGGVEGRALLEVA